MSPETDHACRPAGEKPLRQLLARLEIGDHELIDQAFRHSSYVREIGTLPTESNERLEFLGDAVLDLVVAERLYRTQQEKTEGQLTKIKAAVVNETALAEAAKELGIGDLLRLGRGEEETGCRDKPSILGAALEGLIGAIFIIHGFPKAREFVLAALGDLVNDAEEESFLGDFKSALQERTQQQTKVAPTYEVVEQTGPPHDRTFVVEALLDGRRIGIGQGKSKRRAEQRAAADALQRLDAPEKPRE